MTIAPRRPLVTEAEFLSLPESLDRIELIDGEVIVSPSPTSWHQTLVVRLVRKLGDWAEAQEPPAFLGLSPLDVRFGPGRILQPDLFLLLGGFTPEQRGPIDRIPEVCIEVLSLNRVYDRVTKRQVYAQAGVKEFWAVETSGLIERWHGAGLELAEDLDQVLESPLLPGLRLDLVALFRRP
ncbi:MAG: Uma2 family endonuclease [Planctomycetota bacterium]